MAISTLNLLLEKAKSKNVDYPSDYSMAWFANQVNSMTQADGISLKKEIRESEKEERNLLIGRFYHFDYFPMERGDSTYESYDRTPLILYLGRREGILYGLNINYLRMEKKIPFMNKCFRFLVGNLFSDRSLENKIALKYDFMENKGIFLEHRVIFRKYLINRIKNPRIIPLKYIKIFSTLDVSGFLTGEAKIQSTVLRKLREEKRRFDKRARKTI